MRLIEGLERIRSENLVSFHMPGHKNGRLLSSYFSDLPSIDITEIPGADDLHQPHGIIQETEERLAEFYGSRESHILVNGSTSGIYSAIMSVCRPGEKIIMARACHRSVYSALILGHLNAAYIYPKVDPDTGITCSVSLESVKEIFKEHPDAKALVLTSPTYHGIISDIEGIASYLHQEQKILIVDEAHGAHLALSDRLPMDSISCGADLVIQSFHKTLPAFTQTAVIHAAGDLVDLARLREMLSIHQTSSPSYMLMASVDAALDISIREGKQRISQLLKYVDAFKLEMDKHPYLQTREENHDFFNVDPTRLVLVSRKMLIDFPGLEMVLRKDHGIQVEYSYSQGIVLIPTIANVKEDFDRLVEALMKIDFKVMLIDERCDTIGYERAEEIQPIYQAFFGHKKQVLLSEATDCICGNFVIPYPPGIPLMIPGEKISLELIRVMKQMERAGIKLVGMQEETIAVLEED
jgi:arginine decarboxylase